MTIPLVFLAKATIIRLLISAAFAAILLVSFDSTTFKVPNNQQLKNETVVLSKEAQLSMAIPISGGAVGPESFSLRWQRWQVNESRWVGFGVTYIPAREAKAMTIRQIISTAFAVVFAAVLLVSFDSTSTIKIPNIQEFNDETIAVAKEIQESMVIPIPGGAVGPESFAFDGSGGGPYTGVSDGRIIRWQANESRWVDFAVTSPERHGCDGVGDQSQTEPICGRPLGLRFNEKTNDVYIADAYMGLLVVGPNGGLATPLTKEVDGVAFGFTNSLDIDPNNGVVYFTDSSTRFPRRKHISVIITGDDTGRLIKFDLKTRKTTLLLNNLKFPNGVALSKKGDFLLFVETTTCRLFKFWLKTPKAGKLELIAQLPGFPDNIKRNMNGEFWVGINSKRGKFLEWIISNPWIGNMVIKVLPIDITRIYSCLARLIRKPGLGIRLNKDGNVVEIRKGKRWNEVSEVCEENGNLWIGSVTMSHVVRDKVSKSSI